MKKQTNGNSQLNEARDSVNSKVSKLKNLGGTKGVKWKGERRNRAI